MFVAVLEAGSFAAAAARLGTSSGQASKLVSRLEAELGVRLLNRTTRAVSPTEAGQAYFERIRPLLDELDGLDLSIRNIAQVPRGRLRLTAPLTFGTMELAPALNDFARQYPQIELDVGWLATAGVDPVASVRRYAGRVIACHLKDYNPQISTDVPQRKLVAPGAGTIDFAALLKAMREANVQHGFIEVDVSDDALGDVRRGLAHLEKLKGCA